MNIKKITILFTLFIGIILLGTIKSYSGSISISSSTKNVEPGKTFTVTITGNNATGKVTLTGSNCKLSSSSTWVENNSQTITVTAGGEGTAKIIAVPTDVSDSDTAEEVSGSKSTSVTVATKKEKIKQPSTQSTSSNNKPTTTASSTATSPSTSTTTKSTKKSTTTNKTNDSIKTTENEDKDVVEEEKN